MKIEYNQRSSSSSGTTDHANDDKNKVFLKFKIPKIGCSGVDEQAGGCGSGSSSSAEKMKMKMKMMINNNKTKRVCVECNKEFESGKALGGHMRVHADAIKKQQRQPMLKISDSENSMSADHTVSCSLCAKIFPSMKSLFGHMRCHPERDWRGINPPPGNNNSSSLSEDYDDDEDGGDMVFDCSQQMPRWPVKGPVKARRGGKRIKREFSVVYEDWDEDDYEEEMELRNAVNDLLLLKHMDCSDSSGLSTLGAAAQQINGVDQNHEEVTNGGSWIVNNREEESDDMGFVGNGFDEQVGKVDDYDPVMRKMGIEEGGSTDHVMKDYIGSVGQEGNAAAGHVVENHHVEDESDGMDTELVLGSIGGHKHFDGINDKDNHGEKMIMGNSKNNKAKKMKMMMELDQEKPPAVGKSVQAAVSITTDKYKCSSCNKSFSSHQALGGHRSSHNKFKVSVINADGSTKKHPPHQPSSVSALAPPDQNLVRNEELDESHHQQLNTSHDQVNRVLISEECATKRNSINEVGRSSKADHISSTIHQCCICNKTFPSGQALGGHKRCHWTAPAADAQTEAQAQLQAQLAVKSSGAESGTQAGGKRIRLMGFDLNVPASMVDDEAQDGGARW